MNKDSKIKTEYKYTINVTLTLVYFKILKNMLFQKK